MTENRLTFDVAGEPRAAFMLGIAFGLFAGAVLIFAVGHVASHYAVGR